MNIIYSTKILFFFFNKTVFNEKSVFKIENFF